MDGFETLSMLTRSPVRLRVLRHLLEDGPANTAELTDCLATSRRTVSRTLSALEEAGLATSEGRTYRATTYAELLAPELFTVLEAVPDYRSFATFLDAFPTDAIGVDLETVDGTATVRRECQPHAPVSHVIDALEDATHIRLLAPVASPLYVRPLVARVRDGATVEAVVNEPAYDEFCAKLRGGVTLAGTLADVSLAVRDEVPFGLLQCADRVVLGAYDGGVLQATLETEADAVQQAARETFRAYRDEADPIVG
ncbi:ArsR family transcriptional regulator [Salinadaptatus halalkaliphilus]|uniref:ArsR family transcriptional regulator n=1 Tax=Salinadaptatus halalkaliphilus TaxID=2419781 RepID=A0A4S3TLP1_9EURY|nr:helix-turn-helix domain-containing protein [Salinadaptatus halalkaliphilus]THE64996.1 ArsR family transcriptional regulator [Salinadaptatus halalkaliphilus]